MDDYIYFSCLCPSPRPLFLKSILTCTVVMIHVCVRVRVRGAWVAYNSWGMGRDPERYDKPQDMRPERWIPWKQPDPYEFPVFQAGPRVCLGKDMALFEAKLLTTMLIRCFRFEMDPAEAAKVTYSMMMTMSICNDKGCPADQPRSHHLWMLAKRRT